MDYYSVTRLDVIPLHSLVNSAPSHEFARAFESSGPRTFDLVLTWFLKPAMKSEGCI